jgi:hypothetical protein
MESVLLRIELLHVKPLVWRRLRVPARWTLARLHRAIQIAFGWEDRHLHEYQIGRVRVGSPKDDDEGEGLQDESEWTLHEVVRTGAREFVYSYDFGDQWDHLIVFEPASRTGVGKLAAPVCLAGENAAPPEDVGGPPGYAEFLAAMADPAHTEHEELLAWVGGEFDPSAFDLDRVNRQLQRLRSR